MAQGILPPNESLGSAGLGKEDPVSWRVANIMGWVWSGLYGGSVLQAMVQGRPSVQEAGLSWDDAGRVVRLYKGEGRSSRG